MSAFWATSRLKSCGDCDHWIKGRAGQQDMGTCTAQKNSPMTGESNWCRRWEPKGGYVGKQDNWKSQPLPLVSVEHAKDAMRIKESGDVLAFERWCSDHAGMVVDALRAWSALEWVMRKTNIEGLTWWSTPGIYGMQTSDTPDCVDTDEDEQWQWPTLHEVVRAAAADFAQDEEE